LDYTEALIDKLKTCIYSSPKYMSTTTWQPLVREKTSAIDASGHQEIDRAI